MSKKSLAQVFQRWIARGSRVVAARPKTVLRLEEVESRVVPATTPPVESAAALNVANAGGAFAPAVAADPLNPSTLAMAVAQPNGILIQVSFDGGTSWTRVRDTNSPFNNNPAQSNIPQSYQGDTSLGKLFDANQGRTNRPDQNQFYTNVSAPSIAFSRGGSIYVTYLEHNLAKTSGALVVERFDVTRANTTRPAGFLLPAGTVPGASFTANGFPLDSGLPTSFDLTLNAPTVIPAGTIIQYDLDRARDWDDDPNTPATERWRRANGSENRAAVLYQWIDNGTVINRPTNPYIAVDTNPGTYTDTVNGAVIRDEFANATYPTAVGVGADPAEFEQVTVAGSETVFVAWAMEATAPTVDFNQGINAVNDLGYIPNTIMLSVGRLDANATIDRQNPDAPVNGNPANGPLNLRQPAFMFSTPVPVNDGGHFLGNQTSTTRNFNTGGAAPTLAFTPSSLRAGAVSPGRLTVTWQSVFGDILQSSVDLGTPDGTGRPSPGSASYLFRSNDNPAPFSGGGGTYFDVFGQQYNLLSDATPSPPPPPNVPAPGDIPGVTTFALSVGLNAYDPNNAAYPLGQRGFFTALDDLDVSVALSHPRLEEVSVVLVAPNGTRINLMANRVDRLDRALNMNGGLLANGGVARGATGTDLGTTQGVQGLNTNNNVRLGFPVGTVFNNEAPRRINDPVNLPNYVGSFRPDGSLASLYGLTAAELSGTWFLEVTDFRDAGATNNVPNVPVQTLRSWSLNFTSRLDNSNAGGRLGTDRFVSTAGGAIAPGGGTNGRATTVTSGNPANFGADQLYPRAANVSPSFGVGPGVSVAFDNSLGSFSRFAGRMYMAFTAPSQLPGQAATDTNIYLLASDNNGLSWFRPMGFGLVADINSASGLSSVPLPVNDDTAADNFSTGNRAQYMPTVTVDPATGAVVVMWYDARNDANNSRVATYISTSIDGGATFSAAVPVNPEKFAIDAITGKRVDLEPVPTNVGTMTTINPGVSQYGGTGIRQALVANAGVIKPFWTGNVNGGGSSIFTATVRTAAGPRVLFSDMGAVSDLMVDTAASGAQLQTGAVLIRDQNNAARSITDAFGQTRTQYNDTFAADGTRRIDGFRVVFDRPIYFGPNATTPDAAGGGFTAADVEVRFRGTSGLLNTATQGALLPLAGVVPIAPQTIGGVTFATAFFVQFQTPQSAVGTYSYAIGTGVTDRIQGQPSTSFSSLDTPLTLQDPGVVESSIVITPAAVAGLSGPDQLVQNLRVAMNITHTFTPDIRVTLIAPDGTQIILADQNGGLITPNTVTQNFTNTRFDDSSTNSLDFFTNPFNSFNDVYQPYYFDGDPFFGIPPQRLSDLNGKPLVGTWKLRVEDFDASPFLAGSSDGGTGTLDGWSLVFRDANGDPLVFPGRTGNGLDQDADGVQQEVDEDRYSAPTSTAGTPFGGPFDVATRPLLVPGPHVERTYVAGQQAAATSAVISNFSTSFLEVTLDREIDSTTLSNASVASVTGPNGPMMPNAVLPGNVVNGGTRTLFIGFAAPLPSGQYGVTLSDAVFVTDDLVLNGTTSSMFIRFDRDINPASFTAANVLRISGPVGNVPLTGVAVTAVNADRTPVANGTVAARLFRVDFPVQQLSGPYSIEFGSNPAIQDNNLAAIRGADLPQLVTARTAASNAIAITLSSVTGALTPLDLLSLIGPTGPVNLATGVLTGSGLNYTLTFPAALPAGQYVLQLDPAQGRNIRVANSGLPIDSNFNAGLDLVTGRAQPTAGTPTVTVVAPAPTTFLDVTLASNPPGGLQTTDIVQINGPTGIIPVVSVASLGGSSYRITIGDGFTLQPAGQYVVNFSTDPARNIQAGNGQGVPVTPQVYPSNALSVPITPGTVTTDDQGTPDPSDDRTVVQPTVSEMAIEITDDFIITQDQLNRVEVLLNILHPNDRDLTIELLPPAASNLTPILLYRGADATAFAPGLTKNFVNTRLVDRVGDLNFPSILQAQPPYSAPANRGFSPQTPLSVLVDPSAPVSARGTWVLRVTNRGTNAVPAGTSYPAGTPIQLTNWQLTLPRAVPGSGLGERVADRFTAGFRVFTQNPTNALTKQAWTPVGPAPTNEGANSSRITGVAVDPSDPSGNTVYVSGASGGVWKTTNFMTQDIDGPQYVPLTDFGPTNSINIQSLAVFPRNNDPAQSIVFALTGEGNTGTPGVGLLRSADGGKTWVVLDSTDNRSSDPAAPPGTVGKVSDPGRNRAFVGTTGFKVAVDPNLTPEGGVIVYIAVSGGNNPGVWRSRDGGLTWTLVRSGAATDVVLAAGSANTTDPVSGATVNNGNLQRLYAAFRSDGVYFTDSAPSAVSMSLMTGAGGLPSVKDFSAGAPNGGFNVTVNNTPSPNGPNGRIALAAPALTNDPLRNSFLKDWLYAVVVTPAGRLQGLYQTKDAGKNWTQVQIPLFSNAGTQIGYPSNNETLPDHDPFSFAPGGGLTAQGNYDIVLTVDPSNPAVLYLAGLGGQGSPIPVRGSIKLDLTTIKDSQAFTNFDNSAAGGGTQGATVGGIQTRSGTGSGSLLIGGRRNAYSTDFLNVIRDPNNPFLTNSTVRTVGVGSIVNDGSDIRWQSFADVLDPGVLRPGETTNQRASTADIHAVFPFLDPRTGQTRFIYGGDQGIFTGVDRGDGELTFGSGFDLQVTGSRNGNLQLSQFYNGAVAPSQLAADIAGSLFYGQAQDNGFPVADARALTTGNVNWRGPTGDGAWVEVDPTGSGTAFQYRWPCCMGGDNNNTATANDFFRVMLPNTDHEFSGGIGRTFGLIQAGDNPATGAGQWPLLGGFPFAINPSNPLALVMASGFGRVFRTTDQGVTWIPIGEPGAFALLPGQAGPAVDGSGPGHQAFGAPDANNPSLTNNFIYVGTQAGRVFVTTTGGGSTGTPWGNISAGLDGSAIRRIVPNPAVGSKDVFAVTFGGVYYKADGTDLATPWVDITGSLFGVQRAMFGDTSDLQAALRYINVLAVDWRFTNPVPGAAPGFTAPDLYVGGMGGVFKSSDFGQSWALFPSIAAQSAVADGGYLPNVEVTDLDLSIGNLNPANGKYQPGGLNLLLATTYGRGSWAIRLSDNLPNQSFISGPAVASVINPNPAGGPSDVLDVQFSGPVDPATMVPANFRLTAPGGAVVPILSVTQVTTPGVQNRYRIAFQAYTGAPAQYQLTVGFNSAGTTPTISDPAGNLMNQNQGGGSTTVNGEPTVDQYTVTVTLNGQSNSLSVASGPPTLTAGTRGTVQVRLVDSNGTLVPTNGSIALTTTGPGAFQLFTAAGVPITGNSVNLVNGVATFQISMTAAGPYPFSVVFNGANVNPTTFNTTVTAAAAAFATLAPGGSGANAGTAVPYTITYQDQYLNPTSFTGTATVNLTGAVANGPGTIPVTGTTATFNVTTVATGTVGVTAVLTPTGGGNAVTSNTATISVGAGAATTVSVIVSGPQPFLIGSPVTVTVRVTDANGNLVAVNGPLSGLTVGNDPNAVVSPANPQLVNGVATFTVTYNTPGTYQIVASAGANAGASGTFAVSSAPPRPTPTQTLSGTFAAATGVAGSPIVTVYRGNGQQLATFNPFDAGGEVNIGSEGFKGGIRSAVGDVTGDGIADYVFGTGPTITATIQIRNGATNEVITSIRPFGDFKGGVFVGIGDVDGDGIGDIVVTPDEGGGPRVTIYRGKTFSVMMNFFGINDPAFRGGARAALGDINGDGNADLVVAAGFGGGPRISIYDGAALARGVPLNVIGDFFLFEEGLRNGCYVALGDVNGDGLADLIGGAGPGGGPRVLVLNSATLLSLGVPTAIAVPLYNAFLGDEENRGGVRVAAKNMNNDNFTDIVVASGEGGGSRVEAYNGADLSQKLIELDLLPGYTGGVFVG